MACFVGYTAHNIFHSNSLTRNVIIMRCQFCFGNVRILIVSGIIRLTLSYQSAHKKSWWFMVAFSLNLWKIVPMKPVKIENLRNASLIVLEIYWETVNKNDNIRHHSTSWLLSFIHSSCIIFLRNKYVHKISWKLPEKPKKLWAKYMYVYVQVQWAYLWLNWLCNRVGFFLCWAESMTHLWHSIGLIGTHDNDKHSDSPPSYYYI